MSANFLFAVAHFQVIFFSLHSQLVVILSFGGEEGCVSHIYEMLEGDGGW